MTNILLFYYPPHLHFLRRMLQIRFLRPKALQSSTVHLYKFLSTAHDDVGSSDSSDDEKEKKKLQTTTNKEALNKLNILLNSMLQEDYISSTSKFVNKIAKPKGNLSKRNELVDEGHVKEVSVEAENVDTELASAAKNVAESLGGNVKQTESELLSKLLSHSVELDGQHNEQEETKSTVNLSDLIVGMKIDRSTKPDEQGRAHQVRMILGNRHGGHRERQSGPVPRRERTQDRGPREHDGKVDLFGAEPLNIFRPREQSSAVLDAPAVELKTWNFLLERELRLAVTHPPANILDEMILWTEQGKLWKFPINNEQGMEEESKVSFAEHVFLEPHLEPWCPRRGPIRHFMELVCVGLSKNPYISAQDKRNHIMWFQNYFEEKKELLKEVGALGVQDHSIQSHIAP